MQVENLTPQIAPLPEPGLIERLTLESPMPLVLSLLVIGVGGLVVLNSKAKLRPGLLVLAGAWALAGAFLLVGSLVQTPRESLMARTRELISALADVDRASMTRILRQDAEVEVRGFRTFAGRESVIGAAEHYVGGEYAVDSFSVPEIQGVIDGANTARTQARVRHTGPPSPASWWRITWYRASDDDPWVAVKIEPLWIAGLGNF